MRNGFKALLYSIFGTLSKGKCTDRNCFIFFNIPRGNAVYIFTDLFGNSFSNTSFKRDFPLPVREASIYTSLENGIILKSFMTTVRAKQKIEITAKNLKCKKRKLIKMVMGFESFLLRAQMLQRCILICYEFTFCNPFLTSCNRIRAYSRI